MAKRIKFTFEGTEYVLEYTRRTVREMESEGFDTNAVDSKPMTMIPMLISGAFRKNHRYVKESVIERIYESIPRKEEFIRQLVEMYNEPFNALIEEPEEGQGNVEWETID